MYSYVKVPNRLLQRFQKYKLLSNLEISKDFNFLTSD